ncbi:uncharacterized protein LOC109599586 [Aethina tumida]|uniref:uncharacterized protein LOC109599586 n=1 Tax=Aethina tumida TaxID=116153 RepID=UPI002149631B|nr:uncharacterized protein LOC109599586 [Aethina tumida]
METNVTSVNGTVVDTPKIRSVWYFTFEFLKLVCALASIISNYVLIYAIVKLRKKDLLHFYVLLWCIFTSLFMVLSPITNLVTNKELMFPIEVDGEVWCPIYELEWSILITSFVLMTFVSNDWFITNFFKGFHEYCNQKAVLVKIIICVLICITILFSQVSCLSEDDFEHNNSLMYNIITMVLIVVTQQCLKLYYSYRHGKELDQGLGISLPAIFVLSWLPFLLYMPLHKYSEVEYAVLCYLNLLRYLIADCNSIFNVVYLAITEPDYRKAMQEAIWCTYCNCFL